MSAAAGTFDGVLHDGDGYPTQEALDSIQTTERTTDEMLTFITEIWCSDFGHVQVESIPEGGRKATLVTGGWSGNEDIVEALTMTMFHMLCWQSSRRGGAHEYTIAANQAAWPLPSLGARHRHTAETERAAVVAYLNVAERSGTIFGAAERIAAGDHLNLAPALTPDTHTDQEVGA